MDDRGWLTQQFEENRARLRGVAYRMLGSLSEAEDAVQEAWVRLERTDMATVENLAGWLTTVVSRVCLDMLRTRRSRREELVDAEVVEPITGRGDGLDPEAEAVLADSVGVALLVVLDTLTPAERLAFVLHDLFGLPFDEIGVITGRSPAAAKQLASRARRRVRGAPPPDASRRRQRALVDAFLEATRAGDIARLLTVLDPDAVIHIDAAARIDAPPSEAGRAREVHGAATWVPRFVVMSRWLRSVEPAIIDGAVGVLVAPRGRLSRVLTFAVVDDRITRVEVIGDADHLRALDIVLLS